MWKLYDVTYAVTWSIPEGHERLHLVPVAQESLRNEVASCGTPEFGRGVHVQVGKIDQHARLESDGLLARGQFDVLVDDTESSMHSRMKAVDLHDDGVKIRHLRVDLVEIRGIG